MSDILSDNSIFVVMESGYHLHHGVPYVDLYSRNYNDKFETVTHSFQYSPYFYCPAEESYRAHELIISVDDEILIDAKGREIRRVNVKIPSDILKDPWVCAGAGGCSAYDSSTNGGTSGDGQASRFAGVYAPGGVS